MLMRFDGHLRMLVDLFQYFPTIQEPPNTTTQWSKYLIRRRFSAPSQLSIRSIKLEKVSYFPSSIDTTPRKESKVDVECEFN